MCQNERRDEVKGILTIAWCALPTVICIGAVAYYVFTHPSTKLSPKQVRENVIEGTVMDYLIDNKDKHPQEQAEDILRIVDDYEP